MRSISATWLVSVVILNQFIAIAWSTELAANGTPTKLIDPNGTIYGIPLGTQESVFTHQLGRPSGSIIYDIGEKALIYGPKHLFLFVDSKLIGVVVSDNIVSDSIPGFIRPGHPVLNDEWNWCLPNGIAETSDANNVAATLNQPYRPLKWNDEFAFSSGKMTINLELAALLSGESPNYSITGHKIVCMQAKSKDSAQAFVPRGEAELYEANDALPKWPKSNKIDPNGMIYDIPLDTHKSEFIRNMGKPAGMIDYGPKYVSEFAVLSYESKEMVDSALLYGPKHLFLFKDANSAVLSYPVLSSVDLFLGTSNPTIPS